MPMLEPVFNPDELNAPFSRPLRVISVILLATGAALALSVVYDTIRHWSTLPHPTAFVVFVGLTAALALWVAARLAMGLRIARPVAAPPRPSLIRVLGL